MRRSIVCLVTALLTAGCGEVTAPSRTLAGMWEGTVAAGGGHPATVVHIMVAAGTAANSYSGTAQLTPGVACSIVSGSLSEIAASFTLSGCTGVSGGYSFSGTMTSDSKAIVGSFTGGVFAGEALSLLLL